MKGSVMLLTGSLLALGGEVMSVRGQSLANAPKVEGRALLHPDGTRTDSIKDVNKHEMIETTYDARSVVIAKKTFLLNANGDPTQGVIYDGAGNLIARVQFFFDDLGRMIEERCSNTQGQIFRRVIHRYDANGKALPADAHDFAVNSPTMRPSSVDFTHSPQRAPGAPRSNAPVQPGQGGQIETVSPHTGTVVSADPTQPVPGSVPALTSTQTPADDKKEKKGSKLNPFNWFKKDK
ncbi:MAG: hypothetical protein WCN98_02820 [Verrucomicrobiaceae bacterium]